MFEPVDEQKGEEPSQDDKDDDALMDHVSLEFMNAVHANDKSALKEALEVLMAHMMTKLCNGGEAQ